MFNYLNYFKKVKYAVKKLLKYIVRLIKNRVKKKGKFARRIQKRHGQFWKAKNAEAVRNTIMHAADAMQQWQDVQNWQRKLSNKYNAREFAKKHDCKVAALYWKGRDCSAINFNDFPEDFVIRPTTGHSLHSVFLLNHSLNLMDGKIYQKEEIRDILSKVVQNNPYTHFLIEEFVRTEDAQYKIPDDYKFYMFNGHVGCIQVINRLNSSAGFTSWYDENWNQLPNLTTNYAAGEKQPRPKCFEEMKQAAIKLSKSYKIFSRIDFYATDKGAVFGEFTPTPGLGKGFTRAGDKLLAEYWDRFCKGMI